MAGKKLGLILLLAFGMMILMGGNVDAQSDDKVCPLICFEAKYMTCPDKGYQHLKPVCNCCLAQPGSTLYLKNGQTLHC